MARTKTISDEDILAVARELFRAQGHDVSTRLVAERAGISEGVLYQRFGNKDDLFFAAMAPTAPDVEKVLGPEPPTESARKYLKQVLLRMTDYFGEVLPVALRVVTHPSFNRGALSHAQTTPLKLVDGLTRRLAWFESQKELRRSTAEPTAQLLARLAHDSALAKVMFPRGNARRNAELDAIVDVLWKGAAPSSGER